MLVKNYAEICPIASRMVTTTGNTPVEGRTVGKGKLYIFASIYARLPVLLNRFSNSEVTNLNPHLLL